jgi:hypothetical protein
LAEAALNIMGSRASGLSFLPPSLPLRNTF